MSNKGKPHVVVPDPELPELKTNIELKVTRRPTNGITLKGRVVRHLTLDGISHAFQYLPEGEHDPSKRHLCMWVKNYGDRDATWVLNANKRIFVVDAITISR